MPQDIIDNTRAAYSTDPTTATGYSAALGVPTGRYIKPAGVKGNCVVDLPAGLQHAGHPDQRAAVHARRLPAEEAVPVLEQGELRSQLRSPERVRQRQLQPPAEPG